MSNKKVTTRKSNGTGSIYFDAKGNKWVAEIQWTDKNSEKHRKKFSGQKKTIVKNKLDEFKRQLIISQGDIEKSDITFEEFATQWMLEQKHKLKPTSYARKEVTLINQVYPYIGSTPINDIRHIDVQNMVNKLGENELSYSTIKKAYEAVRGCFKSYRIKTGSSLNPCEGITLPENTQHEISDIVFFNEQQRELIKAEAVRQYSNGATVYRLGHAIIILMYTGLRIGELLALKWEDIDLDKKTIVVNKNAVVAKISDNTGTHYKLTNQKSTKTKSGNRILPMTEVARKSLAEIFKINGDKEFVISSKNGKQISPRNINRMFHSILKQTGITEGNETYGVHTLRHTFASMLFQNGCDVKVVSEILGHSDTKITENIYIHLIQQQKVKAIEDIDKYSS